MLFRNTVLALLSTAPFALALAAPSPLLPEPAVAALASELDGNRAKRDIEVFSLQHRMRASRGIATVTQHIFEELKRADYENAEILRFPADGKTMFGTQKSRLAWDAYFAELWDLEQVSESSGDVSAETRANAGVSDAANTTATWVRRERLASWKAMPLSLAQDSDSGQVTTDLVDVGTGTKPAEYEGKDVRGKLVLVSSQPEEVQDLAITKHGAAGIISYAQNQKTAWWKEDENLVRWGHLNSFNEGKAFAFVVSLKQARAFQSRLAAGETVRLEATVRAERHVGEYTIATATIAGSDPALADQEIAFSCHLDHPRPGANDNASGCATNLEVARTYAKLIREGRLAPPLRTIRFIWPPEIEGTVILLNARPDLAKRIRAVVHMDMVGGGPNTKAVFHVTRSPMSLPNFVNDVAEAFAAFVNSESDAYASGRTASYPLVAPGGGKEALLAQMKEFDAGSDHVVYTDSSFKIPSIYMNDWPDRYIHTTGDVPANIDPTKLERAGFIGAASAWYLANLTARDLPALFGLLEQQTLRRTATVLERRAATDDVGQKKALEDLHRWYEAGVGDSVARWVAPGKSEKATRARLLSRVDAMVGKTAVPHRELTAEEKVVYVRCPEPKGPMSVFGFDYLEDRIGKEKFAALELNNIEGERGGASEYALEALSLVDGRRSTADITSMLSAEFGKVPASHVASYSRVLNDVGVLASASTACK